MVISLLRQFPGYTLSTLLDEDAELVRLVAIHRTGTRQEQGEEEEEDG